MKQRYGADVIVAQAAGKVSIMGQPLSFDARTRLATASAEAGPAGPLRSASVFHKLVPFAGCARTIELSIRRSDCGERVTKASQVLARHPA